MFHITNSNNTDMHKTQSRRQDNMVGKNHPKLILPPFHASSVCLQHCLRSCVYLRAFSRDFHFSSMAWCFGFEGEQKGKLGASTEPLVSFLPEI